MLSPKKVQWRKVQKGRMRGKAYRGSDVSFGQYGLMATEPARITARQIEAARGGNIWIRIFPDKPITQKPAETRMGKGKGNPEYWVAVVQPGRVLYEMDGVSEEVARDAFRLASNKLPLKTKFICREQI